MKETIIVLGAKKWSLTDEITKQEKAGVTIHYLMTGDLKDHIDTTNNERGYIP